MYKVLFVVKPNLLQIFECKIKKNVVITIKSLGMAQKIWVYQVTKYTSSITSELVNELQ